LNFRFPPKSLLFYKSSLLCSCLRLISPLNPPILENFELPVPPKVAAFVQASLLCSCLKLISPLNPPILGDFGTSGSPQSRCFCTSKSSLFMSEVNQPPKSPNSGGLWNFRFPPKLLLLYKSSLLCSCLRLISPLNPPILGDFGTSGSPQSWGARGAFRVHCY